MGRLQHGVLGYALPLSYIVCQHAHYSQSLIQTIQECSKIQTGTNLHRVASSLHKQVLYESSI